MPDTAALGDLLVIATRMEQNGRVFYTTLARRSDRAQIRAFCLQAAEEETSHMGVFQEMRDELGALEPRELDLSLLEPAALVAMELIQPARKTVHRIAMSGNLKDALDLAMRMEESGISFYKGLCLGLPEWNEIIREILAEEKKHLDALRAIVV